MRKSFALTILVAFAFSMLFAGCTRQSDSFPSLPEEYETSQTVSSSEEALPNSGIRSLTVALPYSSDTVDLLAKMYYAKETGLWNDADTGLSVDLDQLDSISTNIVINTVGVPFEGADLASLRSWDSSDNMPDVFLSSDSISAYESGYSISLNEYVYDSSYLDASAILSDALSYCSVGGMLYGLPHYSSAVLIFGNSDYLPDTGRLASKCSPNELRDYLSLISEEYEGIIPFASVYQMTPYLGSCFNSDSKVSYMLRDEYLEDRSSVDDLVKGPIDYIASLYEDGLASDIDGEGADPVYSRTAAMWIGSSSQIRMWSEYYPDKLYLVRIPGSDVSNAGVAYLNCYPLCVARTCQDPGFAADFASFLSYDKDALMLIYRLEDMTGFLPVIRNSEAWDAACEGDGIWPSIAQTMRQIMDNAVYCPSSYDNKLYANVNDYFSSYYMADDEFSPEAVYG